MKPTSTRPNSTGFSLLELLIGMVIGLLLLAAVVATYVASKRSYTETEQFSALSDNAHFAELTMNDALLHAGFFGEASYRAMDQGSVAAPTGDCVGPNDSAGKPAANAFNFDPYIFGATIDNSGKAIAKTVDLGCITDGRAGTDVLVVKRVIPSPITDGARLTLTNGVRNTPVLDGVLSVPTNPQVGTLYALTNNSTGLLFAGAGTTHPGILAGGEVPAGTAWPYLYEVYYVKDVDSSIESDPPILARKTLSWDAVNKKFKVVGEDIVQGIEDMRLRIGLDTNNDGEIDTYKSVADMTVSDWEGDNIGSMEIYLLVRGSVTDPQFSDKKTYHMGGSTTVTPTAGPDANVDRRQFHRLLVIVQDSLRNPNLKHRGG